MHVGEPHSSFVFGGHGESSLEGLRHRRLPHLFWQMCSSRTSSLSSLEGTRGRKSALQHRRGDLSRREESASDTCLTLSRKRPSLIASTGLLRSKERPLNMLIRTSGWFLPVNKGRVCCYLGTHQFILIFSMRVVGPTDDRLDDGACLLAEEPHEGPPHAQS